MPDLVLTECFSAYGVSSHPKIGLCKYPLSQGSATETPKQPDKAAAGLDMPGEAEIAVLGLIRGVSGSSSMSV